MTLIAKAAPLGAAKRNTLSSRWSGPWRGPYEDLILKPEFEKRRLRIGAGDGITWMRIVPAIQGSSRPWILHVPALNFDGGRFAHPRAVRWGAKSPYDLAFDWAVKHQSQGILSKRNPQNFRFLPVPLCVFWVIVEENGSPMVRLFVGSASDGSRSRVEGLGHQIWRNVQTRGGTGELTRNALDPEVGFLIGVEKQDANDAKYPAYTVHVGSDASPLNGWLARMDPKEIEALCPLEQTIRVLSDEDQWRYLAKMMAPEIVATIRTSCR